MSQRLRRLLLLRVEGGYEATTLPPLPPLCMCARRGGVITPLRHDIAAHDKVTNHDISHRFRRLLLLRGDEGHDAPPPPPPPFCMCARDEDRSSERCSVPVRRATSRKTAWCCSTVITPASMAQSRASSATPSVRTRERESITAYKERRVVSACSGGG
jgi:hypothetical protein